MPSLDPQLSVDEELQTDSVDEILDLLLSLPPLDLRLEDLLLLDPRSRCCSLKFSRRVVEVLVAISSQIREIKSTE